MKFIPNELYLLIGNKNEWSVVAKCLRERDGFIHFDDYIILFDQGDTSELQMNWKVEAHRIQTYANIKHLEGGLDNYPEYSL